MSDATELTEVLSWLSAAAASSRCDFLSDPSDAYIFGVLVGWQCDKDHEHGPGCRSEDVLKGVAKMHGWQEGRVERLREHRAIVRAALEKWYHPDGEPTT
ncbi:hypothetical protein E2C11_16520 [Streptomyces lavendulae]|nr:hypothetical protein [Streptomyces lavendulae]TXJ78610.1 hypothetical protein E2C11_16520 [Streptomyces lavendulae]